MSTKAEEFRYWAERSGPKKPKSPPRPRRDEPVDTSKPGVSATDRRAKSRGAASGGAETAAGRKAAHALEESKGQPSRKSTRKAANRQKTDTKMRAERRIASASADLAAGRGRPSR
jgi:hypothetical protein